MKMAWEYFIICAAFYATITGTIELAWSPYGAWYANIEYVILVCYLIDIYINMRTNFVDIMGNDIWDAKHIAMNYLLSL